MPTTPNLDLPYPDTSDTPDVPYWLQQLAESVDDLIDRPMVAIRSSLTSAQTVNAGSTVVDMAGGAVVHDLGTVAGMADLANDRIVIREDGYYTFNGRAAFSSNATGYRAILIQRVAGAGDQFVADDYRPAVSGQTTIVSLQTRAIYCTAGEAFALTVLQTSGAALTLPAVNGRACEFSARQLRRA